MLKGKLMKELFEVRNLKWCGKRRDQVELYVISKNQTCKYDQCIVKRFSKNKQGDKSLRELKREHWK